MSIIIQKRGCKVPCYCSIYYKEPHIQFNNHITAECGYIGFTEQNCVCFLTFLTFSRLFHKLMNQYQACLYIFHCGSNLVMKFHNFNIFYKMCYILYLSSALACRVESIKCMFNNHILKHCRCAQT